MKLRYIRLPDNLGGAAVPGCGTIHRSEIRATLTKLSDDLEMPFDFNDYILGSTGKRDYSGDIDLVVDDKWWGYGISAFRQNLEEAFGKENIARNGNMLHLKYPIVRYNAEYAEAQPRTGFVQIDFNFGNAEWEKFYHYSDAESGYKGAHRNLMLAAICATVDVHVDTFNAPCDTILGESVPCAIDGYNRPTSIIRWIFGPNGFARVNRVSVKGRDGTWLKKQQDTVVEGPYKSPYDIRNILFPYSSHLNDLDSLETLMDAVKRNYGMVDQERVWKRTASNFSDWDQGKLFEYPIEISRYFLLNDK